MQYMAVLRERAHIWVSIRTLRTVWGTVERGIDMENTRFFLRNNYVPPLFFFSSRRRHTRSDRDWSSDVVLFRSRGETAPRDRGCGDRRHRARHGGVVRLPPRREAAADPTRRQDSR